MILEWLLVLVMSYTGPGNQPFTTEKEVGRTRYATQQECESERDLLIKSAPAGHPYHQFPLKCFAQTKR